MPTPPNTVTEPVVDTLHGHRITDQYRWLEDAESTQTQRWVAEQNAYTRGMLDALHGRDELRRRLTKLLAIGVVSTPEVHGDRYFYARREGNQNQPVLLVRDGVEGADRVLFDPNCMSAEGTVALDWWFPSHDGSRIALGVSESGDEWSTLQVLDVATGNALPDRIERTRYSSVAWLVDGTGFFYTRYPRPGDVPEGDENYNQRLYFHTLGRDPSLDPEVHVTNLEREDVVSCLISEDGRYLVVTIHKGWDRTNVYLRDLRQPGDASVTVVEGLHAIFHPDMASGTLYLLTNLDAPRYRLVAADPAQPSWEGWKEIIPESPDAVLESVAFAGGRIIAHSMRNASSNLAIHATDGTLQQTVPLQAGTIIAITGAWEGGEALYGFQSFVIPPTIYRLDTVSGSSSLWTRVDAALETDQYSVSQRWYTSRDNTQVSMFIIHRNDLDRSRPQPAVLYGYGGFNVSLTPTFGRGLYAWLERGGVYAVANLRGGAEYGEEWHQAGMLDRKQNVFDDFLAAADALVEWGYTDRDRLGIYGGSNGGLLVGAALTQRPDAFRAVVCAVPLLDMLRYHQFLIAGLWIPEYGSADNPEQFPYIHAYSPYHHVHPETPYPAVLLLTAESDTRVDPLHARKMAALLQASTSSDRPILLRAETKAGHGVGKPLTKLIDEQVDLWSFLLWQLGAD